MEIKDKYRIKNKTLSVMSLLIKPNKMGKSWIKFMMD